MTEQELIIGEKYVPIRKTDWYPESMEWERAIKKGQYFLYYQGIYKEDDDKHHIFSASKELPLDGDYFNPSDVVPYIDPLAKYKLLVQRYDELELLYAIKIAPIDTKELTWKGWKRVSALRAEINELKKELK